MTLKSEKSTGSFLGCRIAASCFAGCKGGEPSSSAAAARFRPLLPPPRPESRRMGRRGLSARPASPAMQGEHTFKISPFHQHRRFAGNYEDKDYTRKIEEDTGLKIEWVGIPQNSLTTVVGIQLAANGMLRTYSGKRSSQFFPAFAGNFTALDETLRITAPHCGKIFPGVSQHQSGPAVFSTGRFTALPQVQMNTMVPQASISSIRIGSAMWACRRPIRWTTAL